MASGARIAAYLQSLTDAFPPFSLRCAPRPAHRATYVTCATVGLAPATLVMAVLVFIIGFSGTRTVVEVPYGGLRAGTVQTPRTEGVVESGRMALRSVRDPATLGPFAPRNGARFVAFEIVISNWRGAGEGVPVQVSSFRLRTTSDSVVAPVLIGLDGTPGNASVASGRVGHGIVVFEVRRDVQPQCLIWDVVDYIHFPRRGETVEWLLE